MAVGSFRFREATPMATSSNEIPNSFKVPRLLRVSEVATLIGVATWRLYALHAEGKGPPALRLGRTLRYPEHLLLGWMEAAASTRPAHQPDAAPAPQRRKQAR